MTADELLAMPDDGAHRYELVRGELITVSPSGARHAKIAARIHIHLGTYVDRHKLGETYIADGGFHIARDPDSVFAPDVGFVQSQRVVDVKEFFPGAPDLAVEVISPSDRYTEVDAKVVDYLSAGTLMVIVVDPEKQTARIETPKESRRLTIDDALSGGDVVPGWSLPLRELFD